MMDWTLLDDLRLADPAIYARVRECAASFASPPSRQALTLLVRETLWGLSQDSGFGEAIAQGMLFLMTRGDMALLHRYAARIRKAGETGATLGRIMAVHLAPVLFQGDGLASAFDRAVEVMSRKGTYTLNTPFELLSRLLAGGEIQTAAAYLSLLTSIFEQKLSYNQSLRLVYQAPKAVSAMAPGRRLYQIEQLERIVKTDIQLFDPFLDGMARGLQLLSETALKEFITTALSQNGPTSASGKQFLSLSSSAARQACSAVQVATPLAQIVRPLARYLRARLGRGVSVKAIEKGGGPDGGVADYIYSDSRLIYMTDNLEHFRTREENLNLCKLLVGLEAGFFEFGSFAFDLDRAAERHLAVANRCSRWSPQQDGECDAQSFIQLFAWPGLADDLFTLFEQARIMRLTQRHYPGLARRSLALLRSEARRQYSDALSLMETLYLALVLHRDDISAPEARIASLTQYAKALFDGQGADAVGIESSADLVCRTFDAIHQYLFLSGRPYERLKTPFNRRFHWDRVGAACGAAWQTARRIQSRLGQQGVRVYRNDLVQLLHGKDTPNVEQVQRLILGSGTPSAEAFAINPPGAHVETLLKSAGLQVCAATPPAGPGFYYSEWSDPVQDYLHDHVCVREIAVTGANAGSDDTFYGRALERHRATISRVRRAFELLKPQGLVLLRQWPEGDALDYRALLDFVVDRRAGRMPSDHLFIKRLKQSRDVAVLLLVDLSRSTANPVIDGRATVLDVAKQALILFCEALRIVGDTYAIAGFSGAGRHCVDYYRIKDFDQPLGDDVKQRIAALRPQRGTRMGAAIRHATAQLNRRDSPVRFLLMLSDGFPNDLDYKGDYATADTRRSVLEARARHCHVKAITVQIAGDPRLDELYGRMHHHVIADVRELPDKLLRLYGVLTRH